MCKILRVLKRGVMSGMGKEKLSEEDIKVRYITPAVEQSGWDKKQIRYEYAFTSGRIILRGNITSRGKQKRADYLLFYKPNLPLAIIEAKYNNHPVGAGLQQAIEYAEALDVKIEELEQSNIIEEDLELLPKGYYIRKSEKAEGKDIKYCAACWQNIKKLMPYIDSIGSTKQCSNCHNIIH